MSVFFSAHILSETVTDFEQKSRWPAGLFGLEVTKLTSGLFHTLHDWSDAIVQDTVRIHTILITFLSIKRLCVRSVWYEFIWKCC